MKEMKKKIKQLETIKIEFKPPNQQEDSDLTDEQ